MKILAIDDKKDNLISLNAILKEVFPDAVVLTTQEGSRGIEIALEEDPDVILLDVVMPELDGFEVCRWLKQDERLLDIPVVFLTAIKGDQASRIKALEVGAEGFLAKPIDQTELIAQIRAMEKIRIANREKRNFRERLSAQVEEKTKELLLSEERYRTILDNAVDSIIIHDEKGRIIDANSTTSINLGYTHEELLSMNIGDIDPQAIGAGKDKLWERVIAGEQFIFVSNQVRKDGTLIPVEIKLGSVHLAHGVTIMGIVRDIIERKRTESELIMAKNKAEESNRLKTAFLSNMSHEVRTPMNAIMGFSGLLQEAGEEDRIRYAGVIHKSSKQLLTVLNDVIYLSRLQSEKLPVAITSFAPASIITDVYQMFDLPDTRKNLEYLLVIPEQDRDLKIDSDEDKIKQVLMNLVSNALRYTMKGSVKLGFEVRGDLLEFYVEDTGIGIKEEEREKIFENFYRSESAISNAIGGTGLGLTIATQLINLLESKIELVSEPGKGSRYFFTFPLEKVRSTLVEKVRQPTLLKNWEDQVILIAEDEPDNFFYLEVLLKNKVKRIDHAINGQEAIDLVQRSAYNLILMDIKMPGIDGIEATRQIKRIRPELPIIAQTAYAYYEERDKVMSAGCDAYLSKPIKKQQLIEVINRFTSPVTSPG